MASTDSIFTPSEWGWDQFIFSTDAYRASESIEVGIFVAILAVVSCMPIKYSPCMCKLIQILLRRRQ